MDAAATIVSAFAAELLAGDPLSAASRARWQERIQPFVDAGAPVAMLLPGFPHKNPNPAKALGVLPDLAEHTALDRLHRFCQRVAAGYAPGCQITIFSDGRVWGDLLGVAPDTVEAYGAALRRMAAPLAPAVQLARLDEAQLSALRDAVPIEMDADRARVRARFVRLLEEDSPAVADKVAAAEQMMARHAAFGRMLREMFPQHVRLSVHASSNAGEKLSVSLLVGDILPYHCTMVRMSGGAVVPMRRDAADRLPGGVTVVNNDEGTPWCLNQNLPHRSEP